MIVVVKDSRYCNLGASRVALNASVLHRILFGFKRRFCPVHYYVAVFFLSTKFSGISERREWGVHGMRYRTEICMESCSWCSYLCCTGNLFQLFICYTVMAEPNRPDDHPYRNRIEAIGLGVAKVIAGSLTSSSSASLSACAFESALHVNRE
ncbi:hypothetical protein RHGRI_015821 [Rhododendron griersonianum]|uniref:Uncharacterized protein n=1 Tax=Rhododendron griersonianum TaxID=479676 RepID=A0AAV6JNN8_9ERIC|nr:hypothetical protein RHGRI_015821 [Rhododendron griersonianum]